MTDCPLSKYDTELLFGYCLPSRETAKDVLLIVSEELNSKANFGKYFAEITECWETLAIMAGGTVVISIVYIFLLKWITKPLLYTSMFIILIMFILLGAWSWTKQFDYDAGSDDFMYAQIGAYVAWALSFLYLVFMCCCWNNISLGASIMEAASDFVS